METSPGILFYACFLMKFISLGSSLGYLGLLQFNMGLINSGSDHSAYSGSGSDKKSLSQRAQSMKSCFNASIGALVKSV